MMKHGIGPEEKQIEPGRISPPRPQEHQGAEGGRGWRVAVGKKHPSRGRASGL